MKHCFMSMFVMFPDDFQINYQQNFQNARIRILKTLAFKTLCQGRRGSQPTHFECNRLL